MPSHVPSSFSDTMIAAYDQLSDRHGDAKLKETFKEARSRVAKRLKAGNSANEIDIQSRLDFLTGSISSGVDITIAYCLEAEQAFEQGGIELAWPALIRAHYFLGLLGREPQPSVETRELRVNSAIGGARKAKKYQPLKDEIIKLLETKRPRKGWRDSKTAIDSIFNDLVILNNNARISTNLASLLSRWSKEKTPFGDAFREAVQKRS